MTLKENVAILHLLTEYVIFATQITNANNENINVNLPNLELIEAESRMLWPENGVDYVGKKNIYK